MAVPGRVLGSGLAAAVAGLAVAGLAGCGQAEPSDETGAAESPVTESPAPESSTPEAYGDCTPEAFAEAPGRGGKLSAGTDAVTVRLVPAGEGPCAGALLALADDKVTGVDVTGLDLEPRSMRVVETAGGERVLRVDSVAHPRGGFQPHLFLVDDEGVSEVLLDEWPLLPYIATDGGALPVTATCPPSGGIGVLSATPYEEADPLTWDARLAAYDVSGGTARVVADDLVADRVTSRELRQQHPELFDTGVLFAGCSSRLG